MLTQDYLQEKLSASNYSLKAGLELPVFWKRLNHRNGKDKLAFTLIVVTIDKYTISIEGMNEILVSKALQAGAIEITSEEDYKALLDIVYDNTLDATPKEFETIFHFFEQQLFILENGVRKTPEYDKALVNMQLLIDAANAPVM